MTEPDPTDASTGELVAVLPTETIASVQTDVPTVEEGVSR